MFLADADHRPDFPVTAELSATVALLNLGLSVIASVTGAPVATSAAFWLFARSEFVLFLHFFVNSGLKPPFHECKLQHDSQNDAASKGDKATLPLIEFFDGLDALDSFVHKVVHIECNGASDEPRVEDKSPLYAVILSKNIRAYKQEEHDSKDAAEDGRGKPGEDNLSDLIPFNSVCTLMDESETDDTSNATVGRRHRHAELCRDKKPELSRKESGHHTHKECSRLFRILERIKVDDFLADCFGDVGAENKCTSELADRSDDDGLLERE